VANLYGKILAELGYLSRGELVVKNASDFIGKYVGQSGAKTKEIFKEAQGNVLLIDEAYMLNAKRNHNCPYRQEVTDTMVGEVQNKPGEDLCVIMCGYKNEMEDFIREANPGLQRRFPIDEAFVFEDFDEEQLGEIFDLKMQQQSLSTTKEGRAVAMAVLKLAKQRPNFGNGGEVDMIISRAISNFRKRFIKVPSDMRLTMSKEALLSEDDFDPEHSRSLHAEHEVDRQFEDLIGLDSQINVFRQLARQVKTMTKHKLDPKPSIPFTFIIKGPPGCGKTTLARKIGNLYYQMGLLATNEVVEASAQDMLAGYTGQTATKTRELIESALGKVLFIDEAYRLTGERAGECFAAEARDELVDALTKPHFVGKVVVILAGYESHMNIMLEKNPGLSSRFRTHIQFSNLSSRACTLLLKKRIEEYSVTAAFNQEQKTAVEQMFESLSSIDGWGNGRDVGSMAKEIVGRVFQNMADEDDRPTANSVLVLDVMRDWHVRQGRDAMVLDI
jgi:AAA+ superfamily predicted ATPase